MRLMLGVLLEVCGFFRLAVEKGEEVERFSVDFCTREVAAVNCRGIVTVKSHGLRNV